MERKKEKIFINFYKLADDSLQLIYMFLLRHLSGDQVVFINLFECNIFSESEYVCERRAVKKRREKRGMKLLKI